MFYASYIVNIVNDSAACGLGKKCFGLGALLMRASLSHFPNSCTFPPGTWIISRILLWPNKVVPLIPQQCPGSMGIHECPEGSQKTCVKPVSIFQTCAWFQYRNRTLLRQVGSTGRVSTMYFYFICLPQQLCWKISEKFSKTNHSRGCYLLDLGGLPSNSAQNSCRC